MKLTSKNFEREVLCSDLPVLVDFWASWCPPCKMMEPLLDKLEKEYNGKVKIGKLNVDMDPSFAQKYNIEGVPTFILFRGGKEVAREVGARSEEQLREMIELVLTG